MKRNYEESRLQVSIVSYLRLNKIFVYSSLNAGARNAVSGHRMKIEGMLAGVSDLTIHLHKKTIFVEIKTLKGRQSKSQKEFQRTVEDLGFTYLLWRSIDDSINFVKNL